MTSPTFRFLLGLLLAAAGAGRAAAAPTHPCLELRPDEVAAIRAQLGHAPLFDAQLAAARARLDPVLARPLSVPLPRDAAGPTHERHKQNYVEMHLAGLLYQYTGDARYADFVKRMLLAYAELYPTLGDHPAGKHTPGRLFWQSLNEAVWLVNAAEAYDCVHAALTPAERDRIETGVLRPMARFLSDGQAAEFNRIHNHGTWAAAAVGLTGYVVGDDQLVRKALTGTQLDGRGGFLRQLDELFSPDGYYCEGPYYARYALAPFFTFARAIENNQPDARIFARRDGILGKAVHALLQQTYVNGEIFPLNDSLKEKSVRSPEIVASVDQAYVRYDRDAHLLAVAQVQREVSLDAAGLAVAQALAAGPNPPAYPFTSVEFRDGPDGTHGGLGLLRLGADRAQSLAVMKYTAFGMEHGHYDKLSLIYYDHGREILSDYGAARFINVEQKDGGRYLPENKSFAAQTVAHNTVVVDATTQYGGKYSVAEGLHSERHFFDASRPDFQVMSARDTTAVPGVALLRTVALVADPHLAFPVVVDVFRAASADEHQYDLPYWYQGQFLQADAALAMHAAELKPLGPGSGYQHLWLEGEGPARAPFHFSWLNDGRYYTISSAADPATQVLLVRAGANDPNLNLRGERAVLFRTRARTHVFASVIEPHGWWDGRVEATQGCFPAIRDVQVLADGDEATAVRFTDTAGRAWTLLVANGSAGLAGRHALSAGAETFTWTGPAELRRP